MSSNDSILSWKDSPVRPNLNKRSDGSTRGRIWGTKFQEIYKGCRNKYITLNDNRCKHIPQEPKVKVRYARTQKTGREFFKEMQMEVSGKKNKKRKEIVLVYICTNIAWSPKSTQKSFLVGQKMSASLRLCEFTSCMRALENAAISDRPR